MRALTGSVEEELGSGVFSVVSAEAEAASRAVEDSGLGEFSVSLGGMV
jgi:hypothetical protein